ncbi:MAG TPA: protein kinase [Pyrinomonadaceae bacterium]|nr:protein kinase [Pyrinomonadaceae bacterium]
MLSPETVLQGRYRIVRQLGQGGMGAVYEAVDLRLDTVVALKETLFTEERLRKQFEREARLLARLHHQALPRVSDHFTEGDGQFLVMQYIPGEDLFEMQTRRQGAFPQSDVLRWADQLCDALDYLHTQDPQIIHRDIKPQNLKLTSRGQVVLLDFGLAKGSAGTMTAVTTSASIFGYTPNYAPLEQVQGLGTDARSDIYSLGATVYHLLTNVKPPDALTRAGAIVNGVDDPLAPADDVAPQVSPAVAHVLQVAMSQKRDDRFESAQMMREALNSAATGSLGEAATVLTSGATTRPNTIVPAGSAGTKVAGQHTKGFASEAQTLLADEATKVRAGTVTPETSTVVRPAAGGGKRSRAWIAAALVALVIAGSAVGFYVYRARKSQGNVVGTPTPTDSPVSQPTSAPIDEKVTQTATSEGKNPVATSGKSESAKHAAKQTENATTKPTPANDAVPHDRPPDRPRVPEPPARTDPFGRPPVPQQSPNEPRVRTFPNGTTMERKADGTTIVTFPNGVTRVIPPGGTPPNRRGPRPRGTPPEF